MIEPRRVYRPNFSQTAKAPVGRRAPRICVGLTNRDSPEISEIMQPELTQEVHGIEAPLHLQRFELSQRYKREQTGINSAALGKTKRRPLTEKPAEIDPDVAHISPAHVTQLSPFLRSDKTFSLKNAFEEQNQYMNSHVNRRDPAIAPSPITYAPRFKNRMTEKLFHPADSEATVKTSFTLQRPTESGSAPTLSRSINDSSIQTSSDAFSSKANGSSNSFSFSAAPFDDRTVLRSVLVAGKERSQKVVSPAVVTTSKPRGDRALERGRASSEPRSTSSADSAPSETSQRRRWGTSSSSASALSSSVLLTTPPLYSSSSSSSSSATPSSLTLTRTREVPHPPQMCPPTRFERTDYHSTYSLTQPPEGAAARGVGKDVYQTTMRSNWTRNIGADEKEKEISRHENRLNRRRMNEERVLSMHQQEEAKGEQHRDAHLRRFTELQNQYEMHAAEADHRVEAVMRDRQLM
ncbi:uncharacterized protein MONOS_15323 [Monocercomonoides exilis]|uniref:uncharacterized protein n=1 Tax=Monocercomonoides exilis TaxID=2049356 RepID=UPI00355A6AD3|nr:hypothetical protein MONOS_15323 [Monocercomonoides exilis]|eukprot:MONOS_15323.1-p1 / transcript=MONOS_15323.1 / gene=MONOS_15323 / organism=Monocercomonoides_exilis_PA203 / gene_product=unspecified product / transcript_product=unspecified product / location=Mono_scaffold01198:4737-6497(+) / protein_length=465 / sequence_SO=supercontig / SO=protein_coding / is_pseudo=false